jgi:hypothetical protein
MVRQAHQPKLKIENYWDVGGGGLWGLPFFISYYNHYLLKIRR